MKKFLFFATIIILVASAFSMPVPKLQDGNCPSSPARLKQADIAVVTVGDGETLNLRVFPGLKESIIVKIPAYTYVTIIAGPICDGGYRWFEVGWEGKDGWSAEVGPNGEYNMIPNSPTVPDPVSTQPIGIPNEIPSDCENCELVPLMFKLIPNTSPQMVGTCITIGAEVSPDPNFRSMRIRFGDSDWQESSELKFERTFCTNEYSPDIYKIRLEVAKLGDNGWNNPIVTEMDYELKDISYFYPGQVAVFGTAHQIYPARIGSDIYIMYSKRHERWLIPNPETAEAICVSGDLQGNMWDVPESELLGVPRGPDIPDILREPDKFWEIKNKYFLPCNPTVPQQQGVSTPTFSATSVPLPTDTPQPLIEAPIEPVAIEEPFYCSWWLIGWLACDLAEANSVEAWCEPQCMTLMRDEGFRPDMNRWSTGTGDSTPLDVLVNAEKETPYNDPPKTGPLMQIRVRESNETPQKGDLIIWQANCGGASSIGHIGEVVSSVGITVNINDANWDKKCGTRNDVQIQILSCMRFVTEPFPAGTYVPTVQPTVINCDDYQGWQNFACNYIPWWKP